MADVLVAYFSRSGVTERLAIGLAAKLGADLLSVNRVSHTGLLEFASRMWRKVFRRKKRDKRDPQNYAIVIIGSSVRDSRLPEAMRNYLNRFHNRLGPTAAFWVTGSKRADKVIAAEIEQLIGTGLFAATSFNDGEVSSGDADAKLEAMIGIIQQRLPPAEENLPSPAPDEPALTV